MISWRGDFAPVRGADSPLTILTSSDVSSFRVTFSVLRSLARQDALNDVVLLHSARDPEDVIFGGELRHLDRCFEGFHLHKQHTTKMGLLPEHLRDAQE
jgi:stearoyl-CoA 9-desaturase NADPH oxidoreductase